MTGINRALFSFWAGFGLPAFLTGNVPDGVSLPWITFEVAQGEAMSATVLVATAWFKHAPQGDPITDGQTPRAALLDEIARAIPPQGLRLNVPGEGFVLLDRNGGSWQTYVVDDDDPTTIGGRISYVVRFYNNI